MKIRKGLLAAATAATVSFSGVVAAPAFADETNPKGETTNSQDQGNGDKNTEDNNDETDQDDEKSFGEKLKENSSDDNGDWDPKAIAQWIAVFTAVLGLIGNVLTFAQKNLNLPKF